jgi:hypothetical protein
MTGHALGVASTQPPDEDAAGSIGAPSARTASGCDGAGWFLMVLVAALLYGLAVSGLSIDGAGTVAEPVAPPERATIMVVHSGPGGP